jgi:hypothetical protein
MGIEDGATNREAHAHSTFFGGTERLEGFVIVIQSGTVISDLDQDCSALP